MPGGVVEAIETREVGEESMGGHAVKVVGESVDEERDGAGRLSDKFADILSEKGVVILGEDDERAESVEGVGDAQQVGKGVENSGVGTGSGGAVEEPSCSS